MKHYVYHDYAEGYSTVLVTLTTPLFHSDNRILVILCSKALPNYESILQLHYQCQPNFHILPLDCSEMREEKLSNVFCFILFDSSTALRFLRPVGYQIS